MPAERIQFRIKHLLATMVLIASVIIVFRSLSGVYEIEGAVGQFAYGAGFVCFLLNCGLVMLFSKRARVPVLIAIVLVSLILSVPQARMMRELQSLRAEVARIVKYVDKYHADHRSYPAELAGFAFERPDLISQIEYGLDPDRNSYYIWFNPTGEHSYGHYYSPTYGYWFEDD